MSPSTIEEESEKGHDDPDPSKFQSVDLALDEIRRRYDDEEQRRSSIDSKSIGLASLDGVIISIMSIGSNSETGLLTTIALLPLIVSIVLMLLNIRQQTYQRPFSLTGHIYAYADDSAAEFNSKTLGLYENCILRNQVVNNTKYENFQRGFLLTTVAILIVSVSIWV